MKKLALIAIPVILSGCGGHADKVKNLPSPTDETITIGQILENRKVCDDFEWVDSTDNLGRERVSFVCEMTNIGDYFTKKVAEKEKQARSRMEATSDSLDRRKTRYQEDLERQNKFLVSMAEKLDDPQSFYTPHPRYDVSEKIMKAEKALRVLRHIDINDPAFFEKTAEIYRGHYTATDFNGLRFRFEDAKQSLAKNLERGVEREIKRSEDHKKKMAEALTDSIERSKVKLSNTIADAIQIRAKDFEDFVQSIKEDQVRIQKTKEGIEAEIAKLEAKRSEIEQEAEAGYQETMDYLAKWDIDSAEEQMIWSISKESGKPVYLESRVAVYADGELVGERIREGRVDYRNRLVQAEDNLQDETYSDYYDNNGFWVGNSL